MEKIVLLTKIITHHITYREFFKKIQLVLNCSEMTVDSGTYVK